MNLIPSKIYPLRKSRHIMKWVYQWYKKKRGTLPDNERQKLENEMTALDDALLAKKKEEASAIAHRLEDFGNVHCKKTIFEYTWELVLALIFALIIATIVRQMWFELYEIPTGSMRPTFREQDHLTVTKTAFGINFPLETKHLYFDPNLVQRTSVLIFSGDGLPLSDVDTTYFGIFPYKKRYIKRLIGKPGDSLYFYGGKIYGVDKEGKDIAELRDAPWMKPLEHIPFLTFIGDISQVSNSIIFKQMNQLAGKLTFNALGQSEGEVYDGQRWVLDDPTAQRTPHKTIKTYSDVLGIRNYAEARLLTKEELKGVEGTQGLEDGVLYLQLHHTPSLNYPPPLVHRGIASGVAIPAYNAIIPLSQSHLDKIMDNLYTTRFVVDNGKGTLYRIGKERTGKDSPPFSGVEDGTYEFYHGKAKRIAWGGIERDIPSTNPMYSHSPENVQKFYNLGIEMSTYFSPRTGNQTLYPHRYAYFRDGDLYLMGAPIIEKNDPTLIAFHEREKQREAKSTEKKPYVAFKDYGPPLKTDGSLDAAFVRTFGITIPQGQYLVLGDNHAVSADSRVFGFVPQNNIQGAPCWIIWPPGDRLGAPAQKPYPFMNVPRAIIWTIVGTILIVWYVYDRRMKQRRIFIKE